MSIWSRTKRFFSPARKRPGVPVKALLESRPDYENDEPIIEAKSLAEAYSMFNLPSSDRQTWSFDRAVDDGYKSCVWVLVCINRIAKAFKTVPWYVQTKQGDTWVRVPSSHPLQRLIDRPNPFWTRQDLFERLVMHIYLSGNAIIHKNMVGNIPVELWAIDPGKIKPIASDIDFITGYEYSKEIGRKQIYGVDEIIHTMFVDPSNPRWGMSPLQAATQNVDSDVAATSWQYNSFQNRAIVDGAVVFNHTLTKTQFQNAVQEFRRQYQGASKSRTPMILGSDAKFEKLALTPEEMDFIESKRLTREEICAIFNVPPPIVGILDRATYENIATAEEIFWLDTIMPLLDDFLDSISINLIPHFADPETTRIEYDVSGVPGLRQYFLKSMEVGRELFYMGVPLNEINRRLRLGLAEVSGGDVGYIPVNMMPASMATNPPNTEV